MKRHFIFGDFNTWYDWRCTLTAKDIPDAEPKYNYIELQGAHGTIDVTEALTGEVAYNDRTLSASFMCSEGTYLDREMLLRNIMASLHGKKMQIIEPDDPDHYFLGRVRVRDVQKFQTYATFTLEALCDPWRYAVEETHRLVEVAEAAAPVMMRATRAVDPEMPSGTCGANGGNLTWTLDGDGVLTISGTGAMASWQGATPPWRINYINSIKSVVIEEGVTTVGHSAFTHAAYLRSVSFPSTLTKIDSNAFYGCGSLLEVYIPSSVSLIGPSAFRGGRVMEMRAYFSGDAPEVYAASVSVKSFDADTVLYYTPGTTGWTDSVAYDAEAGTWNGYTLRADVCEHISTTLARTPNGDSTHTETVTCNDCGEVVSTTVGICEDADGDNKCDVCGSPICEHVTNTNYKDTRNGTHTITVVCVKCGVELSREVVPCIDDNGDDICDVCGSSLTEILPPEVDAVLYNHGVKTLCPELHVEGQVVVAFDGYSAELSTGEYKFAEFKLRQGANLVYVTGNGSVEFIYREATL